MVYQIYPRSFQDTNADGVGDLLGIVRRLDYLQSLHVNAIWLSPFYTSPMADFGYDIANYRDVDPQFGTLDDFTLLLQEATKRSIKVIIDLVPNHTSDAHPWFQSSAASVEGEYADWYIWRDAHPDSPSDRPLPPNNWRDVLSGGPAWEWNDVRQQFYLHSFNVHQPDLNWNNAAVREAIKDVMRFWLAKGVDGFRVDAVYWMAKDPLFRDDSPNPAYDPLTQGAYQALLHENSCGWPPVYTYLSEMAEVLKEEAFQKKDRFMVTEAYPEHTSALRTYMTFYEAMDPAVAAPFNFQGLQLPWQAGAWREFLSEFHAALANLDPCCVASYAFGNHDQPRLASRLGEAIARSAAVMQLTLPGMIFIYYGEEIGMQNTVLASDEVLDPAAEDQTPVATGRDPSRTPMQWSAQRNAGFSEAMRTWLPVASDSETHTVAGQQKDDHSFLHLYKTLTALRNQRDALRHGNIKVIDTHNADVLAYTRAVGDECCLMLINFSDESVTFSSPCQLSQLLVSSHPDTQLRAPITKGDTIQLAAHEAAVYDTADA